MIKINGITIGNDCFPNNERIFKTINYALEYMIDMQYETDMDIFTLMMVKKYLDNTHRTSKVNLRMRYVPYSRMDRQIEGFMFSLKYFCQIINELNFDRVIILDPHSNVTSALLDRCIEINISGKIESVLANETIDYIFYPDNGACKRYTELVQFNMPYFYGNKKRNLKTGEIINYELVDCPDITNKNILIIDDLCAKGGTFYEAGLKLKEHGVNEIILYVSHCENNIYNGHLLNTDLIKAIYTTDSILSDWTSEKIYQL